MSFSVCMKSPWGWQGVSDLIYAADSVTELGSGPGIVLEELELAWSSI